MGTYLLFIIIDQVILAARQTVVWKYIFCNPDKLDGKLLASSFGCAAEIGDIELLRHSVAKGTHLGRHLIQAFEPGEVPPLRKPMRLECSWKKKYWVANTGLYLPPILTRDIFTTI